LERFLGALTKLQKATISIFVSVRLSAQNKSAPNGQIFTKLDIMRKPFEKIQVSRKHDKNNGHFTGRPVQICDSISHRSS